MKASVVMVAYNHERYVSRAIESVLAQKADFDFELIVADDASRDRTAEIVREAARRHPDRVVAILRERNVGPARNFVGALAACRGDYVALLEGDDYWTDDGKLAAQARLLDSRPDAAICCHRVQVVDEAGRPEGTVLPARAAGDYGVDDLLAENFVMTGSALLRRASFWPLPDWYESLSFGDWPLFVLAAQNSRILLGDEVRAAYRRHSGGFWSQRPMSSRLVESARMLRELDARMGGRHARRVRETILRLRLSAASACRDEGRRAEAARHLLSFALGGGLGLPGAARHAAGLAAYALIGPRYKILAGGR